MTDAMATGATDDDDDDDEYDDDDPASASTASSARAERPPPPSRLGRGQNIRLAPSPIAPERQHRVVRLIIKWIKENSPSRHPVRWYGCSAHKSVMFHRSAGPQHYSSV